MSEKIDPINDQNSKNFPIFNDFIQFLSNFSRTSLIRMLKTVIVARISCPVGISEKNFSIFKVKKGLKLKPKMTKNPKPSVFRNFYAIFVTFSTDFVDQNVAKRKHGTVLIQKVFPKNLMQFSRGRKSQVCTKNDKNPKFSYFQCLYAISVTISTNSVDWNNENVHQGSSLVSGSL